ncbi:hypothetical protein SAMN05444374_103226 [Rhodococcoides kroppenstedtii]|uniref:Uncharacterized protein n=2 Tax=Rhodococcoides kroppenstedtii TaxID=293050 RepID=A0A1I0T092_9NOCA|nr:hypothetical protein SAMN05444374_103226 [Rhodococcus kroppenstedtii]
MVKNSAQKRAARAHQKSRPGTSLPEALRAVDTRGTAVLPPVAADPAVPWFQSVPRRRTTCLLCGKRETVLSYSNDPSDLGRVAVYCDNERCDVRTVEVVVVRDGDLATRQRADVRVLEHFVGGPLHDPAVVSEHDDWIPGAVPWIRHGEHRYVECLWCGDETSRRSATDLLADTGRVQMYCENADCRVRETEHVVLRDGTWQTDERPDVRSLRYIDEPPIFRRGPDGRSRGFVYPRDSAIFAEDDKVARRVSTDPVDWEAAAFVR